MNRRTFYLALASVLGASALAMGASAEEFPSKPVKVIIPNPPAGPGDIIARAFAERATKILGQTLVFEYKPGATTTLGTNMVVRSKPDGYTILGFPSSGLTATLLEKNVPYKLREDLRPIIGLGSVPLALVVRSSLNVRTLNDFTALARKGGLNYGSAGTGTLGHLSAAALLNEIGATATHVPYRGNPDVMMAVAGGQVDFFFGSVADATTAESGGEITVLAVTSDRRAKMLENVPTMAELGHPDFNPKLWYAFLAPKQTPTDRVMRLYAAFAEAGKDPSTPNQLDKLGFSVEIRGPGELSKMMDDETTRWKHVIEKNKITLGN